MKGLIFSTWRNFVRNLKRYKVLLPALVLVSAVLTIVLATVIGIRDEMYDKASRYFAGDIVVLGYSGNGFSRIEEPQLIMEKAKQLGARGVEVRGFSRRSTYYQKANIELFFSGYYLKQRRLVGVEWDLEREILADLDFAAGFVPKGNDESAVLISTATAKNLKIAVGDELLVSIKSDRGRTNTAELTVCGIFEESSFFGYQTYMQRGALNRLREVPEDEVNIIGVYLDHPIRDEKTASKRLAEQIANDLPSFGVLESRQQYASEANRDRKVREYGVVTMGAQLQEIEDLLGALTLIAGRLIFMFLCIVVVGVGNTFSMIVWERRREIGTLRAMGMQRPQVVLSFLLEAILLGVGGAVIGICTAVIALSLLWQMVDFPANMVTTLFLSQGRLPWQLPVMAAFFVIVLVIGASLIGSLRAVRRAGKMSPTEAMRQ